MKHLSKVIIAILVTVCLISCSEKNSNNLTGAGSSFIYPVLSIWAKEYANQGGLHVNYQAIGSGGGLQQIYAGTIDFAASDVPLSIADQQKHQLKQFPMVIGGIVLVVNINGVQNNQLVLDGATLAGIYGNTIQYWDDATIKKLNPTLKLPHASIITIHRADGSGTTYNFSDYLSGVDGKWRAQNGTNTMINWPGNGIGAKGNAGVASQVMQTPNSIGYVEYAYAKENQMVMTRLINPAHKIVTASSASFTAAANEAKWNAADGFYQILTNQPGANSWPIVATTFILIPNQGRNPQAKQDVYQFFTWCFQNGKNAAQELDYVAIPTAVYATILRTFK